MMLDSVLMELRFSVVVLGALGGGAGVALLLLSAPVHRTALSQLHNRDLNDALKFPCVAAARYGRGP